jgi:hypothetical protein
MARSGFPLPLLLLFVAHPFLAMQKAAREPCDSGIASLHAALGNTVGHVPRAIVLRPWRITRAGVASWWAKASRQLPFSSKNNALFRKAEKSFPADDCQSVPLANGAASTKAQPDRRNTPNPQDAGAVSDLRIPACSAVECVLRLHVHIAFYFHRKRQIWMFVS